MESESSSEPRSHETDSTSLSLLKRVKENDAIAWERLVDIYAPLIFSWCKRRGLLGEDASDVVQEVFSAVAINIQRFRREKQEDTFRGWLRVITRNQINMHFRKQANQAVSLGGSEAQIRFQEVPDNALNDGEDQGNEQSEIYYRILGLIQAEFQEKTWKAFLEMAINGRSASDVAIDLGMTTGAVRQAKYAVLRRLRSEFEDLLE